MRLRILLLVLCVCACATAEAQDLYLTNARVVDPEKKTARKQSLLIIGGYVVGTGDRPEHFPGTTIDLEGKWIIPGLIDLYTHSFGNAAPDQQLEIVGTAVVIRRMLYTGVTGMLDLFSVESEILGLRNHQRTGGVDGAEIFATGACLTAKGGRCTDYGIPTRMIDNPKQAGIQVGKLATRLPDAIYIVYDHVPGHPPSIDASTLQAALDAAREMEIRTVVQVGTWKDAEDAVRFGADAITPAYGDEPVPPALVKQMVEHGTAIIPTLAAHTELAAWTGRPESLDDGLLRAVTTPVILDTYRTPDRFDERSKARLEWQRTHRAGVLRTVKSLADQGVPVLAGTGGGIPGVVQGYSLHRELELMVEAGLTPWQALAAATTLAGEFLDQPFGVGTGDVATFLVLDASPLEEIRNTRRIHMIIQRAEVVDRAALLNPS